MHTILLILERAFTGAVEEQYQHILWFCWSCQRTGHQVGVLLRDIAVLYACADQHKLDLTIGGVQVSGLYDYRESVEGLLAEGGTIYVVRDDLHTLQIESANLYAGVQVIEQSDLANLVDRYADVWYWTAF